MKVFPILFLSLIVSCASTSRLPSNKKNINLTGYYIEQYAFEFDSIVGDFGFWFYDRRLITKELDMPLAGDISNFSSIFKCKEFDVLNKYIRTIRDSELKSIFNDDNCYYLDKKGKMLYYIVLVSGDFFHLKEPLCKRDAHAFEKFKVEQPCKYPPKKISSYPFLIPVNYQSSDTLPLKIVQEFKNNSNLERVNRDSLNFYVCM